MLGDSAVDVEAARRAGLRAGLVLDSRRCELCPMKGRHLGATPDLVAPRFDALVDAILSASKRERER
jgi:D-glycero-D-manno-heptose 1,7-bisphosphate phosphatase